eukprot:875846_1
MLSLVTLNLVLMISTSYAIAGPLDIIKSTGDVIKSFKEIFSTTRTDTLDPDHPISCTEYCGLDMANAQFKASKLMKVESLVGSHIINQFKGTMFEESINEEIARDPTVFYSNGSFTDVTAIFEGRGGEFGLFSVGWIPIDDTNRARNRSCRKARIFHKLEEDEPCYDVFIIIQDVQFRMAQLRIVVHHEKKSFFHHSKWSEIIRYDPTLTKDNMQQVVMTLVQPLMNEYRKMGIEPPTIPRPT